MDNKELDNNDLIAALLIKGAIAIENIDLESGEIFYKITPKMNDIFPEIYNDFLTSVNNDVMRLWELGFVAIDLLDENPMVNLEPKAFIDHEVEALSDHERITLEEVKRILAK